jgi:HSP20 family protein
MTKGRPTARWAFASGPGDPGAPAPHLPPVDVVEDAHGWRLVFEIPGTDPETVRVDVAGRIVVVRGERRLTERAHGTFLCVERAAGPFERVVELPEEPDPEGGSASYADGLLTLEIPRRPATRRRTIPIRPGRAADKK